LAGYEATLWDVGQLDAYPTGILDSPIGRGVTDLRAEFDTDFPNMTDILILDDIDKEKCEVNIMKGPGKHFCIALTSIGLVLMF